jgi:acyl carrier protein
MPPPASTTPAPLPSAFETELLDLLQQFLLDPDLALTADDSLIEAGLDSMGIMQLLILIEERWGVVLAPEVLSKETFSSVRRLAVVIQNTPPEV